MCCFCQVPSLCSFPTCPIRKHGVALNDASAVYGGGASPVTHRVTGFNLEMLGSDFRTESDVRAVSRKALPLPTLCVQLDGFGTSFGFHCR